MKFLLTGDRNWILLTISCKDNITLIYQFPNSYYELLYEYNSFPLLS